jgi:NAD(P)-dependent dehydrogenase (short-subunit alcohol dehydrogenase family)
VPLVALTAWQCLFAVGKLEAGQQALIHGAGGTVGRFALQLAAQAGAHVTVTGSTWAEPLVKRLGAERLIDYHTTRCGRGHRGRSARRAPRAPRTLSAHLPRRIRRLAAMPVPKGRFPDHFGALHATIRGDRPISFHVTGSQ